MKCLDELRHLAIEAPVPNDHVASYAMAREIK